MLHSTKNAREKIQQFWNIPVWTGGEGDGCRESVIAARYRIAQLRCTWAPGNEKTIRASWCPEQQVSCQSFPLHPHEPKEDPVHTSKRKVSSKESFSFFFHNLQKITQVFPTLWQRLIGKTQVDNVTHRCHFLALLPPPGRSWGGLGSRSFARVLPGKLLFAKVSYEYLRDLVD